MLTELHVHTHKSKGRKIHVEGINSPEEIIKQAKKNGAEAIALTDHDTFTYDQAKKYAKKYDILLVPGEEITTLDGHLLAIGISEEVKPGLSLNETLDIIHNQGGIGIAAHPFDIAKFGMRELAVKCDAVEVFNALNMERISKN